MSDCFIFLCASMIINRFRVGILLYGSLFGCIPLLCGNYSDVLVHIYKFIRILLGVDKGIHKGLIVLIT